ncbi:hypothetical protein [Microbacterium allomyrinae]|uniref:Phage tail protein n=1 Tax=Microbacterium allomyrinae TaxID=2830666 RepID=A0A9X1LRJ0_9MICO|nr:hypothetical protein [Microbacterium allomyrinae]MCC2030610.1 hypothetical protein [Microbacterium allomyrinae]
MIRVRVGGLLIEGDGGSSPFGLVDLTGWTDSPGMRREQEARATGHGAFSAPGYLSGRVITVDGELISDGPVDQERQLRRLAGVLADGSFATAVVDEASSSLKAVVGRHDKPDTTVEAYGRLATFQLLLWSPDPRRYGESHTYGPGQTAFHYGTFRASPTIDVVALTNMPDGYTITGPAGRHFDVTQPLAAGHVHRVEMRTGRVYLDGALQVGAVGRAETWAIPPGLQVAHTLVPVSGTGSLAVKVVDTFI